MELGTQRGGVEVGVFPVLWDATTLGMPGWAARTMRRPADHTMITGPSKVAILPATLDATGDSGDGIVVLEIAAELYDEAAFVRAASEIDWLQHPAADFARAVRLALAVGAHLLARRLATEGARLYPGHAELEKMACVLAPPVIVGTSLPSAPSARANLEWMRAHSAPYRGRWVALKNGVLVASASTARELREQLLTTDGLFLTRVV